MLLSGYLAIICIQGRDGTFCDGFIPESNLTLYPQTGNALHDAQRPHCYKCLGTLIHLFQSTALAD
jgi:hypothetical protein